MTRMVTALEQVGYVRRRPDPDDGRAHLVAATEQGRGVVEAGRSRRLAALTRRFEQLSPPQQQALLEAIDAHGSGPGPRRA